MYTPEFARMLEGFGGGRQVPAIRIETGGDPVIVSDTLAIAETLAERHPDLNMWPKDPVARGRARSITAEMHSGFTALRSACAMNLRHCYRGFTPSEEVLADVSRIDEIWSEARTKWGSAGPWLFGEYSIADAFYAPVAARLFIYGLSISDAAEAYVQTTIHDRSFKEWRADGLTENYIQPRYALDLETYAWPDS